MLFKTNYLLTPNVESLGEFQIDSSKIPAPFLPTCRAIKAADFFGRRVFMIDDPTLCCRLILCYRNRDDTMLLTLQLFSHVRSFIGRPESFHEATLISIDNGGHFFASTNSLHAVLDSKKSTFHQLAAGENGKPGSLDHLVQFHRDRIGQRNLQKIKSHSQAEVMLEQFHQLTKDELLENGIFEGESPPESPPPVTAVKPTGFEAAPMSLVRRLQCHLFPKPLSVIDRSSGSALPTD